jgi:DNA-directed RNA polymerase specialized sigma24 family protein/uncharacterized protein YkwD
MVRNPAQAADLMHDTFIRALTHLSKEKAGEGEFLALLLVTAKRLALNWLQLKERQNAPLEHEDPETGIQLQAHIRIDQARLESPIGVSEANEVAQMVWAAAEVLSAEERALLIWHVRYELTPAQIVTQYRRRGETTNANNVYQRLHRLKNKFESALGAFIMFQMGRRRCADLAGLLDSGYSTFSAAVVPVIENHTKVCLTCQGERSHLVSASNLLRAFVLVSIPLALRRRGAEAAWEEHCRRDASGAGRGGALEQRLAILPRRIFGNALSHRSGALVTTGVAAAMVVAVMSGGWCAVTAGGAGPDSKVLGAQAHPDASGNRSAGDASGGSSASDASQEGATTSEAADAISAAATTTAAAPTTTPVPRTSTPVSSTVEPTQPPLTELPLTAPPATLIAPVAPACGSSEETGPTVRDDAYAAELVRLMDEYRATHGLPPFQFDSRLAAAAAEYAQFFVEKRWRVHHLPGSMQKGDTWVPFIHIGSDCRDHYERALAHGYPSRWLGENVVYGSVDHTPLNLMTSLFRGQHENPIDTRFTHAAIACFRRTDLTPVEVACVQVLAGAP